MQMASAGGVGGRDWFSSGSGGDDEQSPPVLATNYLSGDGFRLQQRNNFLKFSRSLEHNNFSGTDGGRFFSSGRPSSLRSIKTDLAISIAMDLSSRQKPASSDNVDFRRRKISDYFPSKSNPKHSLSWAWAADEVIWSMWGAEATEQGNCYAFKATVPHCCEKRPVIIDLLPGTPYTQQTKNCCKGGVLTSMSQDPSKSFSTFQMNIGGVLNYTGFTMPVNFSLGVPGYTCGDPFEVPPSRFSPDKGRRWTQALSTWYVTCMYSQFVASQNPKCCVSLSAFYNNTITPCPKCSCRCQDDPTAKCTKDGETPSLLQQKHDPNEKPSLRVICSNHMCPIRVHWHVKQNYKEYWRVKMTVTNLNVMRNYSQWNMVVLLPNLQSIQQVFNFNYKPLSQYGYINATGMLWGIQYFNDMLLQAGEGGNAQTEIIFHKDKGIFTLSDGWAFPRRIMFNGDECVMPPPDHYPTLPNTAASTPNFITLLFSLLFLIIVL
ncbi:hypothetical protein Dsin_032133 [Dipteronia sinensis]|uniref:COBRA C-terminal domain-containing protein n=1 Tax=Dipteronia sinensis TaxID=43782 RepID=A0AAE0DT18_9ROSI|nr:hypothetical protein Dsin_032133 [Dipteronia sinensis]